MTTEPRASSIAARAVGYGTADQPWPVVTGRDAKPLRSRRSSLASSTDRVQDTKYLPKASRSLVDTVLSGKKPEDLRTSTYNNDVRFVPRSCADAA